MLRSRLLLAFPLVVAGCGGSTPPASPSEAVTAAPSSAPAAAVPSASPTQGAAPRTLRYKVIAMSRPSGELVVTLGDDGSRSVAYDVVENGRGPSVKTRYTVAANGTLESFDAKGHDTMGTLIDEHVERSGGRMRWVTLADRGDSGVQGAFYVPLAPSPDVLGRLAAALRKAGGSLPLLPLGEAHLAPLGETTLHSADRTRHVTGYLVEGLDFEPTPVWLDDDGELFGTVSPWSSILPEGWEAAEAPLLALQRKHERERYASLKKRLAHEPPAAGLAVTHARVFDAAQKAWRNDSTVVVQGGRITAVGPSASAKVPAGAEVIDAAGKALLPGLWDMHAHLSQGHGPLNIASGVTTARDLGNDPDELAILKTAWDQGEAVGPRILRGGFVEGRNEKAAASKITAETPDEAKAAVAFYKRQGYEQLKIYNSVRPELVPVLVKEAHAAGLRVSGHVPVHMRAEEVVRLGYDEVQHVNMLFLNFFVDKDTDTRTLLRFSLVAENAAGLDLDSPKVKDFVRLLRTKRTVIDPTVNAFEDIFLGRNGQMDPLCVPVADRLPAIVRRGCLTHGLAVPEGKDETYRASFRALLRMVKKLHDNGIPLVAGTDSIPGLMMHRELELYAQAGLPTADILALATLGSAKVMGKDKTSGSIAPGKDADFFLVDGDPLARISDVRRVVTTVKGGVVYPSKELYAAMSILPWK